MATEKGGRIVDDAVNKRAIKMKKVSNYFSTMFDMDAVNPFAQFIKDSILSQIKQKVRDKMDLYDKGETIDNYVDLPIK